MLGQINASLISVASNRKSSQLIEYKKVDKGYLPVGSDDILESVHLKHEDPNPQDNVGELDQKEDTEKNDERYVTPDSDPDYDLSENVREM